MYTTFTLGRVHKWNSIRHLVSKPFCSELVNKLNVTILAKENNVTKACSYPVLTNLAFSI